jgi:CO/xanthine dehydrogenase FAD-binding subunit
VNFAWRRKMVACQQRWLPAAAALQIEQGTIRDARLALGRVAAKPWRVRSAEAILAGSSSSPAAFRRAAEAALAERELRVRSKRQ